LLIKFLPVITYPDLINFFRTDSGSDLGEQAWKCVHKLQQQQFDGGLRFKKARSGDGAGVSSA